LAGIGDIVSPTIWDGAISAVKTFAMCAFCLRAYPFQGEGVILPSVSIVAYVLAFKRPASFRNLGGSAQF
jgi:hypothetical protein